MKLHLSLIFIAILILEIIEKKYVNCSENLLLKKQKNWSSERIIEKIKRESKIHQIVLIRNLQKSNQLESEIIQEIEKNLPTLQFNCSHFKQEFQKFEKIPSFRYPRSTILFTIFDSSNKTNIHSIKNLMELIRKLSRTRIRPKCLILQFAKNFNYSQFLEEMWLKLFLDLTILEVTEKKVTIHYLNPFLYLYEKKSLGGKNLLFPDKLKNLQNYPLKVGVYDRPPFASIKVNSTNHPIQLSGSDIEVGRIFSQLLNFKLNFQANVDELIGRLSCDAEKLTGFYSMARNNRIQFISITTTNHLKICDNEYFENLIFTTDNYIAIVPKLKEKNSSITVGKTFYYSLLLSISIIIIVTIISAKMNFDGKIWNWTIIFQVLFGVAISNLPKIFIQRIIFGCLLIIYFYFSFNMYGSLTAVNFQIEEEREIETMNDLIESGLQLNSEPNKVKIIPTMINDENFTIWAKKGQGSTNEKCLETLLNYKNVTCVMRLTQADWYADFYREQNLVKYVTESIVGVNIGFILESGSPYVEKMVKIYRKILEFGLVEKFKVKNSPNSTDIEKIKKRVELMGDNEEWKLLTLLHGIMIVGYISSFISLIIELIINRWKRLTNLKLIFFS